MYLLTNGRVITRDEGGKGYYEKGAVAYEGTKIVEVGEEAALRAKYPQAEIIDARGGVIMPAFINAHTHIYSALARGLSIVGNNPTNFYEVLDGTWWAMDRKLTLEGSRASADALYIDCIKQGVTTIFDHHAAYCEIPGSLFQIGESAKKFGKQTRSANRATAGEMISLGPDGFVELHGDRYFGDDAAVVGGIGWKDGRPVTVIAIERGTTTKERMRRNFGMAHPEGYRKARRLMHQAEKFGRPVLCLVDTSGAFCGIGAEERGQGEAIAQNLMEMSGLKTPIVSVVTGEGGSGGALALSVADRILMLSSSAYSVVSPEACASILWKDTERANEAAEALKLTAPDLLALGIIDGIVDDRGLSHEEIAGAVMSSAFDAFDTLGQLDDATLTNLRYEKYRAIGQYRTM